MIFSRAMDMKWLQRIAPHVHTVWHGAWPPDTVEAPRRLYDHELVVFVEGDGRVRMNGREIACPAGTFLIVPPDRLHVTIGGPRKVYRYCVHFDWVYRAPIDDARIFAYAPARLSPSDVRRASSFVPRKTLSGEVRRPSQVEAMLNELARRWAANTELERASCGPLLSELLLRLLWPSCPEREAGDRKARLAYEVRGALRGADPAVDSIQSLLESLGYSYAHLCRLFRSTFGVSPLRYVNALRIERAKELLARGGCSVKEASSQAGFSDAGYFCRLFRKIVGLTPGAFAEKRCQDDFSLIDARPRSGTALLAHEAADKSS